ncbi:MAG: Mrp/NBP35 family ATP-binding protein [Candidatus Eisenbacteria bacterium]|uniref:Iron-sulfur cluster carrier protein n=1 Tax=Eiseniibacteriota bacterium TaxID=2212470 RepID=A0A948S1H2_UNCEI|nr:Mrp/NBP35 family ATP-binding protein [Candidatus Eisenbacteria bacterium]MBU1947379.1 Mrp/NBP35 family ATP-binding protein [Candidatus Eisenbacteria bacterium]MBU2693147.1 Mrp/NBP35 family ATP-binding protein [Candidatus Eisenbacteria bacterium]
MTNRDGILQALQGVKFPESETDIVTMGCVKEIKSLEGGFTIILDFVTGKPDTTSVLEERIRKVLDPLDFSYDLKFNVVEMAPPPGGAKTAPASPPVTNEDLLEKIPMKLAVASAKGGVGKSTISVNLALALARLGLKVGLLDADIHGPSIPMMLGIQGQYPKMDGDRLVPLDVYGIKAMSIGLLLDPDAAVIWRGPMMGKALEQLMTDVNWTGVDLLLLDLPPGTGDIQITLTQKTKLNGGIVISTPQDVALADAIRGITMFRKVEVPVLGLVENMSTFICPHCLKETPIFGSGGGRREAERLGVPLLAQIPIDPRIVEGGDTGHPLVVSYPDSPTARVFGALAQMTLEILSSGLKDRKTLS